jgi:hypothetical protein
MNGFDIFKNYPLETESFDYSDYEIQYGGADNNNNVPTGGFPPIYICEKKNNTQEQETNDDDEKKKREYKTHKNAVSIKSILEKRRTNDPFIKL